MDDRVKVTTATEGVLRLEFHRAMIQMNRKRVQKADNTGKAKPDINPELDLHAMTVDEAIPLVQEYLDEAFMAGLKEVRIVHGKGQASYGRPLCGN